jgi:hypothetical protein
MNRFNSRLLAAALLTTVASGSTFAQTTQPAAPAAPAQASTWAAAVEQVARGTEAGDVPTVAGTLSGDAQVRSFETPDRAAGARAMVDGAAAWKLLGAHAYEFPPPTLANDIAADVKASDLVSDAEKRKIAPMDDAEAARANAIAADWVAQTLSAERDHLVGVAVFWDAKANRPVFILMKGQHTADAYAVKLAVYGDPMPRRRAQASAK